MTACQNCHEPITRETCRVFVASRTAELRVPTVAGVGVIEMHGDGVLCLPCAELVMDARVDGLVERAGLTELAASTGLLEQTKRLLEQWCGAVSPPMTWAEYEARPEESDR